MLQKNTIEKETLRLLKDIQSYKIMEDFNLVGGTAVSLYIGHRKSIDLDLFINRSFNVEKIKYFLIDKFAFIPELEDKNTLKGSIKGVKIDCITYEYINLKPVYKEDGIRLLSLEDIIPMKLSAIIDNGSRLKDFVDIAYLGERFTLNQMIDFYNRKYHRTNYFIPAKALTYFNDIDFSEPVVMINGKFSWKNIEKRLFDMVKYPDRLIKRQAKFNKMKL